jgi:tetratricopeptide (TPR) repeat protein
MLIPLSLSLVLAPQAAHESLRPDDYGVVLDVPGTAQVRVTKNVAYGRPGTRELALDLYLPPDPGKAPRAAIVFLNGIGDAPTDRVKEWGIYSTWPRLVAAQGFAGISMDSDGEHVQESFVALFTFLEREGARLGVDATRLGVYAASANCGESARYLMGTGCARGIRAAAFFYGWPESPELRRDLPVLCIAAESDAVRSSEFYDTLWTRVLAARAPWTLQYASGLPHAFDAFTDTDDSRRVLLQALAFWRSHLEPAPQPPWPRSEGRAVVESTYWGDEARTREALGRWINSHPDDPAGYAMRGMTLARTGARDAKPDLERALALGSDQPGVKGCLGMYLANEGQHARAIELLETAHAAGWRNSRSFGALGHSLLLLGRNAEAVTAYESAIELGIPPGANTLGLAHFNLACGYTRLGRKDEALTSIERAVEQRFGPRSAYERDTDLAPLRDEERFQMALDRL